MSQSFNKNKVALSQNISELAPSALQSTKQQQCNWNCDGT